MDQAVSIITRQAQAKSSGKTGSVAAPAIVRVVEHAEWKGFLRSAGFRDYSYRQSWSYGIELAKRRNAISEHVAIHRGNELMGLADMRIKKLPIVGGGLAYISGGPLVRIDEHEDDIRDRFAACIEALVSHYVQTRGLTLRALAPIGLPERNASFAHCFEQAGFKLTARGEHYRTILLDLDRPLSDIRASFHSHWRRHLNGAERNSLEVTFGPELDRFEHVGRMSDALRDRKGFELDLDAAFFAQVQRGLDDQDKLMVGLVSQNGTPIAGNITAIHGDTAVYLVGASTDAALETKGSYLMHWRTIELAHQRGIKWYDLGGIDPELNPGVTSFKQRTNGLDVTAAGPYEISPPGLRGRFTRWAEAAYLRARRKPAKA